MRGSGGPDGGMPARVDRVGEFSGRVGGAAGVGRRFERARPDPAGGRPDGGGTEDDERKRNMEEEEAGERGDGDEREPSRPEGPPPDAKNRGQDEGDDDGL